MTYLDGISLTQSLHLGTHGTPKVTARQSRWHQLEAAINIVARALNDYLVKEARVRPASSEQPSTTGVPIYITKPFCFEEGRNVIVFKELLQKVCKAESLHLLVRKT